MHRALIALLLVPAVAAVYQLVLQLVTVRLTVLQYYL